MFLSFFALGDGSAQTISNGDETDNTYTNSVSFSISTSISFDAGNDMLTNAAGARLTISSEGILDFGTGDDLLTNSGTINVSGSLLFGDGADRFINEAGGTITVNKGGRVSFAETGILNKGVLSLMAGAVVEDFGTYSQEGYSYISIRPDFTGASFVRFEMREILLTAVLDIDLSRNHPIPGKSHTLIELSARTYFNPRSEITFNSADLRGLGITNVELIPVIISKGSSVEQYLVIREDLTIIPTLGYNVASKPTLSSANFAVSAGTLHTSTDNPALSSSSALLDARAQIEGLFLVGNLEEATERNNRFGDFSGGGRIEILNYGGILAGGDGAVTLSNLASAKIYNEGQIDTTKMAIIFTHTGSGTFELTNKGTIYAKAETVHVDGGVVTIDNEGIIDGSVFAKVDRHAPDTKINATIHIGSPSEIGQAAVIINRKGGEVYYEGGNYVMDDAESSEQKNRPSSAAIYMDSRSNAKIYNEGFIVARVYRNFIPLEKEEFYGVIWEASTGIIVNKGSISGLTGGIFNRDVGSPDLTIYNKGVISGRKHAINTKGGKFTLVNYEDGKIVAGKAGTYSVFAFKATEFHLMNFGEIRIDANRTAIFSRVNRPSSIDANKNIIYNTGQIIGGSAIHVHGAGFVFNVGSQALITGHASYGIRSSYGDLRSSEGSNLREVFTISNSGAIVAYGRGIYYNADTNTSLFINNEGNITSRNIAIHVDTRNKSGDFNVSKINILNKVTGGIYGRDKGISIANIGASASQIADEKVFIQNEGGILGRNDAIYITDSITYMEITNSANAVIASEGIAIDISAPSASDVERENGLPAPSEEKYVISNYGRILSDKIAYRDLGQRQLSNQKQLLNQGFILGDIIIVGAGSVVNEFNADNNLKKDLFGTVAGKLYSYKTAIDVASGVIIGNIYFYDNRNDDKGAAIANTFINSGTIYGNIDMAKGDDIYEHRGNGRVEGIITLGEGADIIKIASGEMVLNILNKAGVEGHRFLFDSKDEIQVLENARLTINIAAPDRVNAINSITAANGSQIYIGNIPLGNLVGAGRPILDMGDTDITINGV
ncbi:MAG: hypothetical protein ACR2N8_02915, partial [Parvibaculales bacterium]